MELAVSVCDASGVSMTPTNACNKTDQLTGQMDEDCEVPPCAVCWDQGSGFHYGVYSCEGCKGFFKRTVQKNLTYVCKESNGMCQINRLTRNNCQYCRYRRCLEVGMKKEAVREDHTPGGKPRVKKVKLEDNCSSLNTTECDVGSALSEKELLMIQQLIEAKPDMVSQADETYCDFVTSGLMNFGYVELRLIIDWSRQVSGFRGLLLEDQMALLKSAFMELSILRLAYRSEDCEQCLRFDKGVALSVDRCVDSGWSVDLVNNILDFVQRLRDLDIDLTEFCLLNAIVLSYPDAAGLTDRQAVFNLQNEFLSCLQKYSASRPLIAARLTGGGKSVLTTSGLIRSARIILRLSALRTVSAKATEKFLSLSLESDTQMNALVLEMMN